ncbi:hypothetical protein MRB53_030182 [Persea americana]|uniref:Uncharacterized protein n=1 Tax=Persea americana TaxID=3435 RepID=A0ACC2KKL2_PERAE|nr:hypothetical protein MRB53_030182 [Persea americana]
MVDGWRETLGAGEEKPPKRDYVAGEKLSQERLAFGMIRAWQKEWRERYGNGGKGKVAREKNLSLRRGASPERERRQSHHARERIVPPAKDMGFWE